MKLKRKKSTIYMYSVYFVLPVVTCIVVIEYTYTFVNLIESS